MHHLQSSPDAVFTQYVYDRRHEYLGPDFANLFGPNIGANGENLTISFLSMNRSSLSLRLLDSIRTVLAHFKGKILVVDNGSDPAEVEAIRAFCDKQNFSAKIVLLGNNHGVSGGRNRAMEHVETDWVMFLDNDMFFIKDPIPEIRSCIGSLGVNYLNLPILNPDYRTLFAYGGHLYVSPHKESLFIGGGSVALPQDVELVDRPAFLSTFLFGGASVIKKEAFLREGGFDEGMFVGFEDIDFSLRLFRSGQKVGNLGAFCVIHAHDQPESTADRDYEKERFSRSILRRSADHFRRKHGMHVWHEGVDDWLKEKHETLGLEASESHGTPSSLTATVPRVTKPRIGLVTDTSNWAFANIASQLERHLSDRFELEILAIEDLAHPAQAFIRLRDADLVHFFWRNHLTLLDTEYFTAYFRERNWDYAGFMEQHIEGLRITTSVYDHLFLEPHERRAREHVFNRLIKGYTVSSERLLSIYREIESYPNPTCVVEDGVDLELFSPVNLDRFERHAQEFVIGWAGNSKWNAEQGDHKGLESIIKPAIAKLQERGLPVRGHFADRAEGFIPHQAMAEYYNELDVYVCASTIEGTPNPVLEAMACGIPVVSTDVGIVPQLFGSQQRQFILPTRSPEALADCLEKLISNRELCRSLSRENLEQVRQWSWKQQAEKFGSFFEAMLADSATP